MLTEIVELLEKVRLKPTDVRIYSLLQKKELGVREIARELGLSTRFVRERLKELTRRGIVKRRLVEERWLGYKYAAEEPKEVIRKIKSQIFEEFLRLEKALGNI
ncbi:MAG: transcriptional regulator [Archaeoglobaceae archaeon]|nr:transcriptional regulator [Archaeoglobaceae archaeon]MDW7990166.1 transcriptional regulator [Archaeoglobaceae archaeon]